MINWLKIAFIIFLCLLINERNAFSDHNKKAFSDSSEKPITKRIINFIPNEPKPFSKIRGDIAKKHCTKIWRKETIFYMLPSSSKTL